jgi:prephenate dehydrogenase
MNFGIVGYGRFGKLWTTALAAVGTVQVYDPTVTDYAVKQHNIHFTTLTTVAHSDIVFILVPISHFAESCAEIKALVKPETLIVDCCSVKIYPAKIMQQVFGTQQSLIATHPLFGPDSAKRNGGLHNLNIVVCSIQGTDEQHQKLIDLFHQLGLQVLITTPEKHDQQMAHSQGLVHFIGRGLAALELNPQELATPDFNALLNINTMVNNDTWQLFLDMHRYNPYTKAIREKFIQQLAQINHKIGA